SLGSMVLTPSSPGVFTNATQQFSVSGNDQFGFPVVNPVVNWAVSSGGGSISTTGLYQAPGAPGSAVVTATSRSLRPSANIRVLIQLPPPTGLPATAANNNTEVDLTWTAPSGTVTGYYVYRGTSAGAESEPLNSSPLTQTSFRDTTVAPFTTYFYTVKAVNTGGASAASNEANATTDTDLALNRPATASSVENQNGTPASYAVDGNSGTRWSS